MRLKLTVLVLVLLGSPALDAQPVVIPGTAPSTAGSGGYSTLLHAQARSYQIVIGPDELTRLLPGDNLVGLTWRRPSWISYGDWPPASTTAEFASFDVTLSGSMNPPGSLSTSYLENIAPDAVTVRQGAWTVSPGTFPGGAVTPAVNPFGMFLPFDEPYSYPGGNLLLTIRHSGNGTSSGFLDTVPSPYCQAIGVSSYTQEIDWYAQGVIAVEFQVGASTAPTFERGDSNGDGTIDVSDAVFLLALLFVPGSPSPTCGDASDANDDGSADISDSIYMLAFLFIPGSPAPPEPFGSCGPDPTGPDLTDCLLYNACP